MEVSRWSDGTLPTTIDSQKPMTGVEFVALLPLPAYIVAPAGALQFRFAKTKTQLIYYPRISTLLTLLPCRVVAERRVKSRRAGPLREHDVMAARRLDVTLYRHLRRAALQLDGLIARRSPLLSGRKEALRFRSLVPAVVDPSASDHSKEGSPERTLADTLRLCFEAPAVGGEAADGMERSFAALRQALGRVDAVSAEGWAPKPAAVALDVGQIFRHKKHGFRGVVVEWFEECPADQEWMDSYGPFERGTDQPFYRTLVDTKDRPQPFIALAAEENLTPLENESSPVEHPYMDQVFESGAGGFERGRHVMRPEYQERFPEDG